MRSLVPSAVGPRGFTLVELLVVTLLLVLLGGFVAASARSVVGTSGHVVVAAAQRRSAFTLEALMRHDVGGAVAGDLTLESPTSLRYAQPLGSAPTCRASDSTVTVADGEWSGARAPVAGRDSVRILADPDSVWSATGLRSVSGGSCPGGSSAMILELDRVGVVPLVHLFETVRLSVYSSGGREWLGLAATSGGSVQPFAGPAVSRASAFGVGPDSAGFIVPFVGPPRASAMRFVLLPP